MLTWLNKSLSPIRNEIQKTVKCYYLFHMGTCFEEAHYKLPNMGSKYFEVQIIDQEPIRSRIEDNKEKPVALSLGKKKLFGCLELSFYGRLQP